MTRRKWLDVAVVVIPFALGVRLAGGQETEDGGVASGAVIRFLWLEPQGLTSAPYPPGTTGVGTPDLALPGVPPPAGQPLWLAIYIANWGPNSPLDGGKLRNWQARMDASTLTPGLASWRPFCSLDDLCFALMGTGIGAGCGVGAIDGECAPAFQDFTRSDAQTWGVPRCNIATAHLKCGANVGAENPHTDPGTEVYGATFVFLADHSLIGGPHTIDFFPPGADVFMNDGDTPIKVNSATLTIPVGRCCFDIGVASTTPCASDVTFTECQDLNSGPFPPVFRDGEVCPDEGGTPCPLGLGSCCNSQAGPLAEVGICNDLTRFSDCECSTCTFFLNEVCDDIIADGLCEADFVAIPTVSEWGLVITTLLLLIGSKIVWRRRATPAFCLTLLIFSLPALGQEGTGGSTHVVRVPGEVLPQISDLLGQRELRQDGQHHTLVSSAIGGEGVHRAYGVAVAGFAVDLLPMVSVDGVVRAHEHEAIGDPAT